MVIEKILKQLAPERIKKEIIAVQAVELPPEIKKCVEEYGKVGDRNDFIWKDLYRAFQFFMLPMVSSKYYKSLTETKVIATIFTALVDDVADKQKNKKLLKELFKIPFTETNKASRLLNDKEKKYFLVTKKIWKVVEKRIKKYPKYKEFKDLLYYDVKQVLNSTEYSYLINKNPYLANKSEAWAYISFNMMILVYLTLDLMCCKKLDLEELKIIREIGYKFQKMARIGNWISTWERELKEKDFTSGVFIYAVDSNVIDIKSLKKLNRKEIVRKIKKQRVEEKLLKEWGQYYKEVGQLCKKTKSIDSKKFLPLLEIVLFMHLSSRGYK